MNNITKRIFVAFVASAVLLSSGCSEQQHDIALTDGNLPAAPQESTSAEQTSDTSNNSEAADTSETSAAADTSAASGAASSQNTITLQEAINSALAHAGLSETEVTFVKTRLTQDNGISEYELEFTTASNKYEYEINANSGSVTEFSSEAAPTQEQNSNIQISEDEAKKIALEHSGVNGGQASFVKSKIDYDNGVCVYDIEFTADSVRYEYEIGAEDGALLEFSAEKIPIVTASSGGTNTTAYITEEEAKTAALNHAGVSASQADFIKVKLDYDNGIAEYEIEFIANSLENSIEYEYEVKADDGTILKYSSEPIPSSAQQPAAPAQNSTGNGNTGAAASISEADAKNIALKHAGVDSAAATFIKVKLDIDNGISEYDIEFIVNSIKYEYEIKADDGAVLEFSVEPVYTAPQTAASGNITLEEAKNFALQYANVQASSAVFIKTKREYDDGITKYDIEFTADNVRYEVEINASNGAVIEFSAEPVVQPNTPDSALISEEEAKSIALKHTGFTAEQVNFKKVELDTDDGITEYKVEFYVNGLEYEVKINAANGLVLEVDIDD